MKTSLLIPALTWLLLLLAPLSAPAQIVADGATNTLSNITNTFTGDVTVGTNGSFTLLVLSDNALLTNSANGVISLIATATSNEVRLISPTARWLMGGTLRASRYWRSCMRGSDAVNCESIPTLRLWPT